MAKAGVFISVVGKNDPKAFAAARAELHSLEATARQSAVGMESALTRASRRLNSIGSSMQNIGKKMTLGVTVPIVAGLGLAAKAAADEDKAMALLSNSLRRNAGLTRQQVAAQEAWITKTQNATGVLDDQLRPALSKLVIAGHSVSAAHREIGIAMDIAAARGKPLNTVIDAMVKASNGSTGALSRMGIATTEQVGGGVALAKAQLAVEKATKAAGTAFGKYGKDSVQGRTAATALVEAQSKLNDVTDKGTKRTLTYDEVLKKAAGTMGGSAARAAQTTSGKMAILKAKFDDLVENIGRKVLPVGEKLVGFLGRLISGFSGLPNGMQSAAVAAAVLAAVLGPMLVVLGSVITAVTGAAAPFIGAGIAIGILIAAVVLLYTHWNQVWNAMVNNPAIAAIAALVLSPLIPIIALVGAVHWLVENWSSVWAEIQSIVQAFQPVIDAVVGFVGQKLDELGAWVERNRATFEDAFDNISTVVTTVVTVVAAVLGFFINNVVRPAFEFWLSVAVPILRIAWETVKTVISGALQIITGIIQTVMALIAGDWGKAWDGIKQILAGVWNIIFGLLRGAVGYVLELLAGAWRLVLSGVNAGWNAVLGFFRNVPGWIIGILSALPGQMLSLGASILQGLWDGISDGWSRLVSWFKEKAGSLLDDLVDAILPGSPSKVTTKLGRAIPDGLRVGIDAGLNDLRRTVQAMADVVSIDDVVSPSRRATFAGLPGRGAGRGLDAMLGDGGGSVIRVSFGDIKIDARGATDPGAVGTAARDGVGSAVKELTRLKRAG